MEIRKGKSIGNCHILLGGGAEEENKSANAVEEVSDRGNRDPVQDTVGPEIRTGEEEENQTECSGATEIVQGGEDFADDGENKDPNVAKIARNRDHVGEKDVLRALSFIEMEAAWVAKSTILEKWGCPYG